MKILGHHLIVEYSECDKNVLNDARLVEKHMNEAVRQSGATIIRSVFHKYSPHGVSGVVVIAESHFAIHTWPEYCYAALDFFTCGRAVNPYKAHEYMKKMLASTKVSVTELQRGIPSETDEIISHKPETAGANTVSAPA